MELKFGEDLEIEELAKEILFSDRRCLPPGYKFRDLNDILSDSQLELRHSREVYIDPLRIDKAYAHGLYHRCYNPKVKNTKSIAQHELWSDDTCHDTGSGGITPRPFPPNWSSNG